MNLDRLVISGFQCFGEATPINLADRVSCFIGNNGAGKTAVFQAISRLFGLGAARRAIKTSDFHLKPDVSEIQDGAVILIDVRFSFPELTTGADIGSVAEFWHQLGIDDADKSLKARMALKAVWSDDGTPDGDIETSIRWIPTLDDDYNWDECIPVKSHQRSAIQAVYVPATRGTDAQVKALLRDRLWRSATWSDNLQQKTEANAADTQAEFLKDPVVDAIQSHLIVRWDQVEQAGASASPKLELTEVRFDALIRQAMVKFRNGEAGPSRNLEKMSDGQKSLFEIALTAAILDLERAVQADEENALPFDKSLTRHVPLTLLLLEEPENSLSPFYLSRIMHICEDLSATVSAQVCLSSHSPAILSRVSPDNLRYCRRDADEGVSMVKPLKLPTDSSEAGKYVRRAVKAFPELYFARGVVLGEGDSEEIVLPALAEARGLYLDKSFFPFVPLAGRYAKHFWALLRDLEIPHFTLLDLDYGRKSGGAATVKRVVKQLLNYGDTFGDSINVRSGVLDPSAIDTLTDDNFYDGAGTGMGERWLATLQDSNVFFSAPLDLDFLMLCHFDEYKTLPKGTTGPANSTPAVIKSRKQQTLKAHGNLLRYDTNWDEAFRWYPYLFLSKSKPVSHLRALTRIPPDKLRAPPPTLGVLLDKIVQELSN